jgi:DNA-binding NarL/FixJ family response regulator
MSDHAALRRSYAPAALTADAGIRAELRDVRVLVLTDQPFEGEAIAGLLARRAGADAHWVGSPAGARKLVDGQRSTVMLWSTQNVGRTAVQPVAALRNSVQLGLVMVVDRIARDALTELLGPEGQSFAVVHRSAAPTPDDIVRALDEVNRGRFSLDPKILDVLLDQSDTSGLAELTDAEREVAELVAGGLRNATIGQRLFKSERTVEKHVSNIFVKLGLFPGRHPDLDRRVTTARIVLAERARRLSSGDAVDRQSRASC